MKILTILVFSVILSAPFLLPGNAGLSIPTRISSCMESPRLKQYEVDPSVNPFYLRGDFDGDGKPDFAIGVRSAGHKTPGLLICQGDGRDFVLGAGTSPKFSTMKDDLFLSSDWEVLTPAEFRGQLYHQQTGAAAKGEVIALTWEDGTGYIYWDGDRYRWLLEPAGGSYK